MYSAYRCFVVVLISSVLVACAADPWYQQLVKTIGIDRLKENVVHISLPPANKPSYSRGDVFIYGKRRVRKVAHIDRETIVWANLTGEVYRTSHNFFTPRTRQVYDDRVVTTQIIEEANKLWPLATGKKVKFTEQRHTEWLAEDRETNTTRKWQCEVEDARISVVPAGAFETFRITCWSHRPIGRTRPVLVISWDYAPAIGHYVRRIWKNLVTKRSSDHQLTAALPARLATQQRIDAVLRRLKGSD